MKRWYSITAESETCTLDTAEWADTAIDARRQFHLSHKDYAIINLRCTPLEVLYGKLYYGATDDKEGWEGEGEGG